MEKLLTSISELKNKKQEVILGNFYQDRSQYNLEILETKEGTNGRFYNVDGRFVPSVTTVLSYAKKGTLDNWIKKVGLEESERIKNMAAVRGSELHSLAEKYLNNDKVFINQFGALTKNSFINLKVVLDQVQEIYMQEQTLYSKKLGVAGRVDLIAKYKDQITIIDFKTSTKFKPLKYINNYLLQVAGYALMAEELLELKAIKGVILICVDNAKEICEYTIDTQLYKEEFKDLVKKFHKDHPNV